ncbi:MAG: hypothetical protein WD187_01225 [Candidatus Woykebacteria bacterium]
MKLSNPSLIRLYIVPVLVIVTIVLLIPLVLMPQLERIKEKNIEVKKGNERLEALRAKLEKLNFIDEGDVSLKLLEMEEVVPSGKELAPLVVGVRALAGKAGLKVDSMELKPGRVATSSATSSASKRLKSEEAKSNTEEETLSFLLSLSGRGLNRAEEFLSDIERAKRLLGIETIKLARQERGEYTFEMEIVAPFKELESSGDIIASPLPSLTTELERVYDFVTNFVNYTNVPVQKVDTGASDPFR